MEWAAIAIVLSVGTNIALFAYGYGKLSQKVSSILECQNEIRENCRVDMGKHEEQISNLQQRTSIMNGGIK